MGTLLRIKCLGQLVVLRDGQPIAGAAAQPRRLAILGLLARAGDKGVTREKLIGYLWPDSDEERARRLLSQAVYMLRRDLGADDAIVGVRDLRLGTDVITADLLEFEAAFAVRDYERAAALYGGPFLDGFRLPGAPEFERWLDEERRVLEHDGEVAVERCATAAENRGDPAAAVVWWRRLAARDPINARVAVRLMRALAAAGDRTGAIRHAAIHQALVQEHLDIPADADVVRLADELRAGTHVSVGDAPVPPAAQVAAGTTPAPVAGVAGVAVVDAVSTSGGPSASSAPSTPATPPAPAPAPRARSRWRSRSGIAVAATLALAGASYAAMRARGLERAAVDPSRVVVVPLENRTGDSTLNAVGPMVAEWVTQGLLRTGLVQVVDAPTMLESARTAGPSNAGEYVSRIAEHTGAGLVVVGSYYLEDTRIRFLMRITEAPSGSLKHTIDVVEVPRDQPTVALEPLRQRVTGALALMLDPRLNNRAATASQPPTYEAYTEFLLGMETFGSDYENSVRRFVRAARLDSTYRQALLWAGMAFANLRRYPPADSVFQILEKDRARLAPYDEANLDYFYGGFVRGDWERSYRGARRMLELAPSADHALYAAGLTAQITNRAREAIVVLGRIDTERGWGKSWAPRVFNLLARASHQLGDHERELAWALRLKESEPGVGWTRLAEVAALAALGRGREALDRAIEGAEFPATTATWEDYWPGDFLRQSGYELLAHGHTELAAEAFLRAERWYAARPAAEQRTREHRVGHARVLAARGKWEESRALYAALTAEDTSSVEYRGALGVLAARTGRVAEADSVFRLLTSYERPWRFGAAPAWAARIAAVRGDREGAVTLLRQALREGYARLRLLHADLDLESLRDLPAFRDILQPRGVSSP